MTETLDKAIDAFRDNPCSVTAAEMVAMAWEYLGAEMIAQSSYDVIREDAEPYLTPTGYAL